jgi:hypothetical protein
LGEPTAVHTAGRDPGPGVVAAGVAEAVANWLESVIVVVAVNVIALALTGATRPMTTEADMSIDR